MGGDHGQPLIAIADPWSVMVVQAYAVVDVCRVRM
jgi:hypothetical protein